MKTKLLFIISSALLCVTTLLSQVPVISINNYMVLGDSLNFVNVDTAQVSLLSPGPAGINQTWSFNPLVPHDSSTQAIVPLSSTPFASDFPTANYVRKHLTVTPQYDYVLTQPNSIAGVGVESSGVKIVYSAPGVFYKIPFTYLDTNFLFDKAIMTFPSIPTYAYRQTIWDTTTADGYGTLILPTGTFNNALRLKQHRTQIDSLFISGTFSSVTISKINCYEWYDKNYKDVLFDICNIKYGTTISKSATFIRNPKVSAITGLDHADVDNQQINVYPNPFSTQTVLQKDKDFKNATLTVYDLRGQAVKQINNLSGRTVVFDRGNLCGGLYFIRLTQDGKVIMSEKIVITD